MSKQIDDHVLYLYQPKKLLGSGAYGHVWRVIQKSTKRQYALKKIFDAFQNAIDAQRTYREITVLHELDHSNIIKLKQVIKAQNNRDLYLVFEFMETDLHSLIGQEVLQTVHIKFVIYQILKALKYLHSAQIIHRDLKPSNVLINSDCEIKICDFGLVRSLTHEEQQDMILSEEVATRWYRSPEMLLSSSKYDKPTDVWSIGCLVAEILMGKPIFPGASTLNQLQMIIEFTGAPSKETIDSLESQLADSLINQLSCRKKSIKDYFPPSSDVQIVKLVTKMLELNPLKRITIDQALKLPMFNQFATSQDSEICTKIIFPEVDDNIRLTVSKYRQIIYRDIERRYPISHKQRLKQIAPIKFKRTHNSLKKNDQTNHQSKCSNSSLHKVSSPDSSQDFYRVKNIENKQNCQQLKHAEQIDKNPYKKPNPSNLLMVNKQILSNFSRKVINKSTMGRTYKNASSFHHKPTKLRN